MTAPTTGAPTLALGPVAADPYPWPWDGAVPLSALAVVLAGWDAGWSAAAASVGPVAPAEAAVGTLVGALAPGGAAVVALAHPAPTGTGGSAGPVLGVPGGVTPDAVRTCPGLDGCFESGLEPWLRSAGRTHLLIAGHGLEGPVHSTLRGTNDRGFECLLVTDACSPLTAEAAAGAVHSVTLSGGIFGAVASTASVLAGLDAPGPHAPSPSLDQEEP